MTPSDWSLLVAGISASFAAAAVVWNVFWSVRKSSEDTRARLATLMLARSERLKQKVSAFVGLMNRITFQMNLLKKRGDELPDAVSDTQQVMTLQTEISVELDLANTIDRQAFEKLQEITFAHGVDDCLVRLQVFKDAIGKVLSQEREYVDQLLRFEKHLDLVKVAE